MKNKFFIALFLCVGLSIAGASLTGCSAGARVGSVGAGAHIG